MILATPPAGLCMLVSQPGTGRRTVLSSVLGQDAAVVALPARPVTRPEWRSKLNEALDVPPDLEPEAALRASSSGWLVVLDVAPDHHREAIEDLAELSRGCPPTRRIAITSTSRLPSSFNELRLADRVVELDGEDLALNPEESAALLRTITTGMDESTLSEVVALCDGWAAALVAAARHHARSSRRDTLTWLRTHGAETLFGPWLDGLSIELRDMLLDTAILDQLHPALVDAVASSPCGSRLVGLAEPRGPIRLAGRPTTSEGPWFDRHPLLGTLLLFQAAARSHEAERHRRAADWHRSHGALQRELVHRLSAGDADTAAQRFESHEDELMASGLAHMVLRWYRTLPESGQADQLLREAWAYALSDRLIDSRATLDRLRLALRGDPGEPVAPAVRVLEAEADVLEAWMAERDGDLGRAVVVAARARSRFGGAWSTNSHQLAPLLEARAALHLGDHQRAEDLLSEVRAAPFLAATIGEGRRAATEAELAWVSGHVVRARTWAARYHRWIDDQDPASVRSRAGGCIAGFLAMAEGDRAQEGIDGLERAVEHAVSVTSNATDEVVARLGLASVLADRRRLRQALEQTAAARTTVMERSPEGGLLAPIAHLEVRLRLLAGDTVRAERLLRGLPPSVDRQLLHLRLALHGGAPSAIALARDISPSTPRQEAMLSVLSAWAILTSSRQRAEQHLLRAADTAAEHGMTSLLADVPDDVLQLARRAASYHVHDPLVLLVTRAELFRRRDKRPRAGRSLVDDAVIRADLRLTRGELQLLAILPTRAGNAQIGDELGVSVNTVKTRLRRLYAKLGVHGRDEAIARAVALGLLAGGAPPRR